MYTQATANGPGALWAPCVTQEVLPRPLANKGRKGLEA